MTSNEINHTKPIGSEASSRLSEAFMQQYFGYLNNQKADEPAVELPKTSQTDNSETDNKSTAISTQSQNVRLKFVVDAETDEVTLLVVDKATREVIRTVPPSELNQYKQGDLVEFFV